MTWRSIMKTKNIKPLIICAAVSALAMALIMSAVFFITRSPAAAESETEGPQFTVNGDTITYNGATFVNIQSIQTQEPVPPAATPIPGGTDINGAAETDNDPEPAPEPIPHISLLNEITKDTVKIAATRVGFNARPANINPDGANKNLDMVAVKAFTDGNVQRTIDAVRMAGEQGADLVLTHEDIMSAGQFIRNELIHVFSEIAETIPGPTSEKFSEIAREFNMYIAACYYEKDGDKFYNSTVLIGRDGEIIGVYRKTHLPRLEQWLISPGVTNPVFKTSIGNIGISICYDIAFPEQIRALALKGADIVLHPTVGWGFVYGHRPSMGEALVRVRAAENQVYLVTAINIPAGKSCIVSSDGTILVEDGGRVDGIIMAEFVPEYNLMRANSYWSFLANVPSIRARMLYERNPASYGIITEDVPNIIRDRYSIDQGYEFSFNGSELSNEIGVLWDQWRQGAIRLPYVWE
jgi:predicted amidohydrolase